MNGYLSRMGGAVLVAGSLLGCAVLVGLALIPSDHPTANPAVITLGWADMVVGLLVLLSLPVVAGRVAAGSHLLGALGFAGLVMGFLSFDIILGFERAVDTPYLVTHHVDISQGPPIGMLVVLLAGGFAKIIGGILFGVAAWRSRAVSRVAAGLVLASSIVFASGLIPHMPELVDVVAGVMILVGFAVCGLELLGVWPAKQPENTASQFSSAART
ncbi:MAG: hypothetical protein PVSMB3_10670 [Candidatus Dormibacteraceae bacterium]